MQNRQLRLRLPSVKLPGRQCTSRQSSPERLTALRPLGGQPCRSVCPSFLHIQCVLVKPLLLTCPSLQSMQLWFPWVRCCLQGVHVVLMSQVDCLSVTS